MLIVLDKEDFESGKKNGTRLERSNAVSRIAFVLPRPANFGCRGIDGKHYGTVLLEIARLVCPVFPQNGEFSRI